MTAQDQKTNNHTGSSTEQAVCGVTYPSATITPEITCWLPNHSDVLTDFGPVADAPITP